MSLSLSKIIKLCRSKIALACLYAHFGASNPLLFSLLLLSSSLSLLSSIGEKSRENTASVDEVIDG